MHTSWPTTDFMKKIKINLSTLILLVLLQVSSVSFADPFKNSRQINTGNVFSFASEILKEEREIYISFPANYSHSVHKYPVIIVLDGEYLFPLVTSIVKHQASRNYMPESIVVGISNNTGKRMEMAMEIFHEDGAPFFFGENLGQPDKYLAFFKEELIPSLEKQYRINSHRTIIGMSPTFGPVLEAFWNQPDLFRGYIVLAAEIGKYLKNGERIADKLLNSFKLKNRDKSAIYIGTSSKDVANKGLEEAKLYSDLKVVQQNKNYENLNYKFELLQDEDNYGMAIKGVHNGLRTIYPPELWDINYKDFWRGDEPTNALIEVYEQLTNDYGFEVVPIESAFYSVNNLVKTAEILGRQERNSQLQKWLSMAISYYPKSPILMDMQKELHRKLAHAE
ncbi:MAG: hypothetical protein GJ680_05330 [Alteromonadaceae bacterium]|nr:hypothetical protein [Alteromonadaceae bacterium]